MKVTEFRRWESEAMDLVFKIVAASPNIAEALIFKGARVLNLHLGTIFRQSYDLDSNIAADFIQRHPDPNEQQSWLETELLRSLRRGFELESPVRYRLDRVRVTRKPPKSHPRGWDAFEVSLTAQDLRRSIRGLPPLVIDVAAPGELSEGSAVHLDHGGSQIRAYSLERIAGEKLRAFLTSLPAYNTKIGRTPRSRRVKDVYDLARIQLYRPISDHLFWRAAGEQFRLACGSRLVDCSGIATFEQELTATRTAYEQDPTLPKDIGFDEAWAGLRTIIELWEEKGIIPLEFLLPAKKG